QHEAQTRTKANAGGAHGATLAEGSDSKNRFTEGGPEGTIPLRSELTLQAQNAATAAAQDDAARLDALPLQIDLPVYSGTRTRREYSSASTQNSENVEVPSAGVTIQKPAGS